MEDTMESFEPCPHPAPAPDDGFSRRMVTRGDPSPTRALLRILTGFAFAWAFGAAAGAGHPAPARLVDAMGVAAPPLAFSLFFTPSLWVLLTLFDRGVGAFEIARAAARGVSTTGMVLAGLVPLTVFFELTAGGPDGQRFAAALELCAVSFAGLLGLRAFACDVLEAAPSGRGGASTTALVLGTCGLGVLLGAHLVPGSILALHGGFR
jgi:hypothetical protein